MKMKKVFYVVGVGCEECTKKDEKMPSFKEKSQQIVDLL